jgi:hypothetical protein
MDPSMAVTDFSPFSEMDVTQAAATPPPQPSREQRIELCEALSKKLFAKIQEHPDPDKLLRGLTTLIDRLEAPKETKEIQAKPKTPTLQCKREFGNWLKTSKTCKRC